eukprot:4792493-Pyramimonas_sp.AAC.1
MNIPWDRRVSSVTFGMLGDSEECNETEWQHPGGLLKAKAGELGVLLEFALHKLNDAGGPAVFTHAFIVAGSTLSQFLRATRALNYVVSQAQRDELVGLACIYLRACETSGVNHVPKHHLFVHLADRTAGTIQI